MKYIRALLCMIYFGIIQADAPVGIKKYPHFIGHIHLIQELKDHFGKTHTSTGAIPVATNNEQRLTQTETYLKKYRSGIDHAFSSRSLEKHKALIDQIIQREKELSATHYFFYHAHNRQLIILQDFIKLLHSYLNILSPRRDFTFLRFKGVLDLPYKNVNEYLDAHDYINDHDALTMSQMISVNVALFGNHCLEGESTFSYFLGNNSISWASLHDRLEPIFEYYKFDTKYLTELTGLAEYLASSTGNLLQICIPHAMVDDVVYLSQPLGRPYQSVVLEHCYDHEKSRHTSIRPLLEYMRTSPELIDDLSGWQARIMFFDPLVDMHPAIKVFRYNTISSESMALYEQKLKDVVVRLLIDYLKGTENSPKNPLVALRNYMSRV